MGVWSPSQGKQRENQGHPYTSQDAPQAAVAEAGYAPIIRTDANPRSPDMTRITETATEKAPATQIQNVTVCSTGQQDIRQQANEELHTFFAMLFAAIKRAVSTTIVKLQNQQLATGLRYRY